MVATGYTLVRAGSQARFGDRRAREDTQPPGLHQQGKGYVHASLRRLLKTGRSPLLPGIIYCLVARMRLISGLRPSANHNSTSANCSGARDDFISSWSCFVAASTALL